jgi:mRNA interferase HigB
MFAFCYYRTVNVISKRGLLEMAKGKRVDNETLDELNAWFHAAHVAAWRSLADVRRDFADADQVGSALIFNIRHNRYRLIVRAEFSVRLMLVKALLTHNEYDREEWKKWA